MKDKYQNENFVYNVVTSVPQYLEAILNLKECNPEGDFIFRGHSSLTYKLIPKIGRTQDPLEIVLRRELQSFNEFKRLYGRFYHQFLKRDMDILMLSQHYGLPTRLLDWTFDPLVALYFACESKNNEDGQVLIKFYPIQKYYWKKKMISAHLKYVLTHSLCLKVLKHDLLIKMDCLRYIPTHSLRAN